MSSASRHGIGSIVALFACVILPQAALAQAPPAGVFSELQTALIARPGSALEPGTVRSRVVQVDTQKITAARRGREVLKLNLFDDAVVEVQIKRVRPTRTGYFISGRPKGMEWGAVRLVVNGPVMVGTVETPGGTFTIRSGGGSRHVIRQIDPSAEPFECEVEEGPAPVRPEPAISSIGPLGSLALPPTPQADDVPTEDGSEIRVLIVYTPAEQARQGGAAGMTALIDLLIQSANQAFEDSGISPRLVLAHSAMVDYIGQTTRTDLGRLRAPDDGYMDEVHGLRNQYAADLVHLLTIAAVGAGGTASRPSSETLSAESLGFAVTANGSERTFTHETGHNFGLRHDRYVNSPNGAIYPYAFGYINKSAYEPGAPDTARWRTIMAYPNRCASAGFHCTRLLRFSNPDQTYQGDPLGVPADDPTTGPDGPADGRLAINTIAPWVGSFRSEACTDFTVSPETPIAPVGGGEVILTLETAPGCLWELSSQADFLTITSEALFAGSSVISIDVEANGSGAERNGTLTVAGQDITVRQLATGEGVCDRTTAVMQELARRSGFADPAQCTEVTGDHLAGIGYLDFRDQNLSSLRAGDFEGLSGLRTLYLFNNRLTELPEGLFAGLTQLETLHLPQNRLTELPEGLFDGLTRLEVLSLGNNQLTDLPVGLFADLTSLRALLVSGNRLTELSNSLFAGLESLTELSLYGNRLTDLPGGLFAGLSQLNRLRLDNNRLADLSEGLFDGLTNLEVLNISNNLLTNLHEDFFDGLTNLEILNISNNLLTNLHEDSFDGLTNLQVLNISNNRLTDLPERLFDDLINLDHLNVSNSRLTDLPGGLFDDLVNLDHLDVGNNRLTDLPEGIFSGLPHLSHLALTGNEFTGLREDLFSGLSRLRHLGLDGNGLTDLPSGLFGGLFNLEAVYLGYNALAHLPEDLFAGLSHLNNLDLRANYLASLPADLFSGLTALKTLNLRRNTVDPLPFALSLEKVGDSQFKAVAPAGALFALVLPVSANGAGEIEDGASTVTIPAGAVESAPLGVTRVAGTADPVNVDLGTLPDLPADHFGYTLEKDEALPLRILPSFLGADTMLISLSISDGKLDPVFAADITRYAALVPNAVSSVTVTPATSNAQATVAFLDAGDQPLADADATASGHQVNLGVGENTIKFKVTSEDATATETYTLVVTRDGAADVCSRTAQVRDAILAAISGVDACADVSEAHLSGITELDLSGDENVSNHISSLKKGDFDGLTALETLNLYNNQLRGLPAGIFSNLTALESLDLSYNNLRHLSGDVFSGLTALRDLSLGGNNLGTLPANLFSGLTALEDLALYDNRLSSLPVDAFYGLSALEDLQLHLNRLQDLSPGIFSGLSALQQLTLYGNQFSHLPVGIFSGLSGLRALGLHRNIVDPLPLSVSLEKVGSSQFKAVAPTGAPFSLVLPVSISSTGEIEGGARTVIIPAGAVESAPLQVAREVGTDYAVTVDLGTLPALPENHTGYVLEKDETLPREILSGPKAPPPGQVTGVEVATGAEQLEVSWTAVSDAGGYKVQWKSGEEAYDEARQAVITGGDTVSHTIAGLTAGTEYTVRVFATKNNADDGPPSNEVTGIPTSVSLSQVTGVEVAAGAERLEVFWTAVSDAGGYKVQWKSGEEAYDESRLALIIGGDAISYTIAELTAGTAYTVRVVATKDNADDGSPSSEVTGIPKSSPPAPVTGVEVTTGVEQLDVSWTAVADASGYKVQWKSSEEAYDESRQTVIPSGDTISYTIAGLSARTEYTIRVLATKDNADDGPPSSEVTGIPAFRPTDAMLISLSISDGALDPAFAAGTTRYAALVANAVSSITVTPVTSHPDATVAYLDAGDQPLADADATTDGHQVNLRVRENTIQVKVTSEDGTATRTYTLVVTRRGATDVCVRTARVRDAILAAISGVDACADVTEAHLSGITDLNLRDANISSLQRGDFDGLTALERLDLLGNQLSGLPAGLFSELPTLRRLELGINRLVSVPEDAFSGLPLLERLNLGTNQLSGLPSGLFSGLSALKELYLDQNRLSDLPEAVFSGLSALRILHLYSNTVDPLPLFVSLEKVGSSQFKAVAPTGAPFSLVLPVSISSAGEIEGGASKVTIPAGAVESAPLQVVREVGTEAAVTVDLGTLPALPGSHIGYVLEKDDTLPREILSGPGALPPAQVTGVEVLVGVEQLAVSWTAVSDAGGYNVQWKSGEEAYDESRQAVVASGDTVSHTIAGLTAGTEYTVRVLATKDNADEGPASIEVIGVPTATQAGPVTGVEITAGVGQLAVSWTAVSDAGGYKVQWKSGQEAYDEVRQAVIVDSDTVSHTITELSAGTEYTVRVLATEDNADDGPPSNEVTGIPTSVSLSQVMGVEVAAGVEQLAVSWTAVSDAGGYNVQWKSGEEAYDESRQAVVASGDTVSHTIAGLTAGTEYTVRVLATKDNADEGPASIEVIGVPTATQAGPVTGVEITAGVGQLAVSWTAVSDAGGYKVQWKSGQEAYDEVRQAVIVDSDTVSHTITELSAGTEYTVRVLATEDNADDGPPSNEVTGIPTSVSLSQVMGVEVAAGVEQLDVSWTVVSDAGGYKVQWKSGEEAYEEARQASIAGGNAVSHTITGLTAGTEYTIRIIATKEHADDGEPSSEVIGTPKALPPAPVTGVEVTAGVEQLDVSWTEVADAGGYKVQWKSGEEAYDEARQASIAGGNMVSHTIRELTAGTEYTVRVIATREHADDGEPSSEVMGIPKAEPPAPVTGVEITAGVEQLDVSWTAVADAGGYKVQWKSGEQEYDEARQAVIPDGDTVHYTIPDLTADTQYTVRVMATKDNADDGLPSAEVMATPTAVDPDVNGDGMLNGDDALVMYHAYASASQVGDGETGGTAASRQTLLSGLAGLANPSDEDLKAMIRKAHGWRESGVDAGGDINEDGEIDGEDAFVMYYAYELDELVGDGETGGTARFRQLLLAAFASQPNPSDEDLKAMLGRANKLREEFG